MLKWPQVFSNLQGEKKKSPGQTPMTYDLYPMLYALCQQVKPCQEPKDLTILYIVLKKELS